MRNQRGAIVNLTDLHASQPLRDHPAYSAAKVAVSFIVNSLSQSGWRTMAAPVAPRKCLQNRHSRL